MSPPQQPGSTGSVWVMSGSPVHVSSLPRRRQCFMGRANTHLRPPNSSYSLHPRPHTRDPGAWGNYADRDEVGPVISTGRNREGRVARRARRRAALKEKRLGQIEEKLSRKKMVGAKGWGQAGQQGRGSRGAGARAGLLRRAAARAVDGVQPLVRPASSSSALADTVRPC